VAFLPKVVCPMCSPAYTALLSSVGLPFLATAQYVLPLTLAFMTVAVGSIYFRAESRRGLGPFWIGVLGAASILSGKLWLDSVPSIYFGAALLIGASIWNAVPKRKTCPACEDATSK
jgi:mercuric ion transport protein